MVMSRVGAAFLFAIETAIRCKAICHMEWRYLRHGEDPETGVQVPYIHLIVTKTGEPRDVPLSQEAWCIIEQLRMVTGEGPTIFDLHPGTVDTMFRKACERAMVEGLNFHDTRHEALTRLAKVYPVMELAKISGHHDIQLLYRVYYNPGVEELLHGMVPGAQPSPVLARKNKQRRMLSGNAEEPPALDHS